MYKRRCNYCELILFGEFKARLKRDMEEHLLLEHRILNGKPVIPEKMEAI